MLTHHIALVPEADGIDPSELMRVAAALQKQVTRDFSPIWRQQATVAAFASLETMPQGYWPIIVTRCELSRASGVQLDDNGQPFAQVELGPHWSIDASRACLEMLINPFGDRTTTGPSPIEEQGVVEMLVEVSGPCGDPRHAYGIHDVLVADFCTPAYFSPAASEHHAYSFRGQLPAPFSLAVGGRIAWYDAPSNAWWLRQQGEDRVQDLCLGRFDWELTSGRELVRRRGPEPEHGSALLLSTSGQEQKLRIRNALGSQRRALRLRALLAWRIDPGPLAVEGQAPPFGEEGLGYERVIDDWVGTDAATVRWAGLTPRATKALPSAPLLADAPALSAPAAAQIPVPTPVPGFSESSARSSWVLVAGFACGLLGLAALSYRSPDAARAEKSTATPAAPSEALAAKPSDQGAAAASTPAVDEPPSPSAPAALSAAASDAEAERRRTAHEARAQERAARRARAEAELAQPSPQPSTQPPQPSTSEAPPTPPVDPLAKLLDTRQ